MEHWTGWIATLLGLFLLVSGIDDLFLCLVYFFRRKGYEAAIPEPDPSLPEKAIAIWVPAWRESEVIERMLSTNASAVRYRNVVFFVGVYPNDGPTIASVRSVAARFPNIHPCAVPHDGPTSKGDCLNWVYQRMLVWEQEQRITFDLILVHDAEDVIHPDELAWMNTLADQYAMIQTPVLAMPADHAQGTATYGIYCDDFAYFHMVEMPARWMLGGFIPSAGVGTGYRRDVIERLASESNQIFLPGALTEDYENGLRAANHGMAQLFAPMRRGRAASWIATREYFPAEFGKAVRQRTRWITGIGLQAWEQHGWSRRHAYWLWRDRKGLLGSPASLLANAVLAMNVAGAVTGAPVQGWMNGLGEVPRWILWGNLTIAAGLVAAKSWASGRVYGWRMALLVPFRTILANLLNTVCVIRALGQYLPARWAGRPLRWVKTEHAYPSPLALAANRERIGQIIVRLGWATEASVEAAEADKSNGMRLGEALVALGIITAGQLYRALGMQTGIATWTSDGDCQAVKRVARMLPERLILEKKIVPIAIDRGSLEVAVGDLPGEDVAGELARFVRLPVRFRLAEPAVIDKIIADII